MSKIKPYAERIAELNPMSAVAAYSGLTFTQGGKKYTMYYGIPVPSCCGAKFFVSEDVFPSKLLDKICDEFMNIKEMLIFIMPVLPSQVTQVAEGVGVIGQKEKTRAIKSSHSVAGSFIDKKTCILTTRKHTPLSNSFSTNNIMRCSKYVYFFSSLEGSGSKENFETTLKALLKADENNILLSISIPSQRSGKEMLESELHLAYHAINPNTGHRLDLFCGMMGSPKVKQEKPAPKAKAARVAKAPADDVASLLKPFVIPVPPIPVPPQRTLRHEDI